MRTKCKNIKSTLFILALNILPFSTSLSFGSDAICAHPKCEVSSDTKKCAGCNEISYCGKEHQRQDWKNHRADCLLSEKSRLSRIKSISNGGDKITKINPNYGNDGYSINCDFCANLFAYWLKFGTLGSYKAGAIPFDPLSKMDYCKKNINLVEKVFGQSIIGLRIPADNKEVIENELMQESEATTFYIVKGYRPPTPGKTQFHSWVAIKFDGIIYHKDPQSGGDLPLDFSEFSSFAYYKVQ